MGDKPEAAFCIGEEPIIVLSNGVRVQWVRGDVFQNHVLVMVDSQGLPDGCGNPWNLLELCTEADRVLVRDKKPGKPKLPLDVQCIMYHHILGGEDEVKKRMHSVICADCWGVLSTSADRTVVHKIYYDYRALDRTIEDFREDPAQKEQDGKRKLIIQDQTDLWRDIEDGLTVMCVMGCDQFKEIYYFKAGQIYLEIAVDHSITW